MATNPVIAEIKRQGAKLPAAVRSRYITAALETGRVESNFTNPSGGDADSAGWRQERASLYPDPTNLKASVARFFQELATADRGQASYQLAADVQRPAAQFRRRYKGAQPEALKLLGSPATAAAPAVTVAPAPQPAGQQAFDPRAAVGAFLAGGGVKSATAVQGLLAARVVAPAKPLAAPAMAAYGQTQSQPKIPKAAGTSSAMPSGTAGFEGKTVAAWIAPALQYARQHGWKGTVNSGYRSYADQQRIYNSGVRPAAKPGTSNHEGSDYPRGAVDVSDAQQLAQILQNSPYAGKLVWAGAKDPVHFSHPHNGSY